MTSLNDYSSAHRLRDIIRRIAKKVVNEERPLPRYGTVVSIDRVGRKCEIQYPGESSTAVVNMGSIQPLEATQVVRVLGVPGDRYVDDVMGPAVFVPPTTTPAWAAATGTATRSTFATGTVTTAQLAEHVKALVDDLLALKVLPDS